MGWGDCGMDSKGRPIGYIFEAICDEPGCNKEIDHGLAYACGDMHGEGEYDCEGYFCDEHQFFTDVAINGLDENNEGEGEFEVLTLCKECSERAMKQLIELYGEETLGRVEQECYERFKEKMAGIPA